MLLMPIQIQQLLSIYLFLMSYQIQSITHNHTNPQTHQIVCQICQHPQIDIYACKVCLAFVCNPCATHRICPSQTDADSFCSFFKIYNQSALEMQLSRRNRESNKKRSYEFPTKYFQHNGNCQRCLITTATKQCFSCQIKNYCELCCKVVHNSAKMQNHQLVVIKQHVQKTQSKQINLNPKSIMLTSNQKQMQIENQEIMAIMKTNLNLVKVSLEQDYKNYQNQISKRIKTITDDFQTLIEEINLKIIQITMNIKEHLKDKYQRYEQKKQFVLSQQRVLNNLRNIIAQPHDIQLQFLNAKIESCDENIGSIMRGFEMNASKDPLEKKCQGVSEEIQQVRDSVSKIQMKKNWLMLDTLKTSMSISTPRGQKNIKNLKSSLFINSARSEKPNPLTMSLMAPKKLQGSNIRIQTELDKVVITKLKFTEQKIINCPEDGQLQQKQFQTDNCLKFGNNKKKTTPKISLLSPKITAKIDSAKNTEVNAKFKIGKGLNAQKSKKTIKEIQNEIFKAHGSSKLVEQQAYEISRLRKQSQVLIPKTSRV